MNSFSRTKTMLLALVAAVGVATAAGTFATASTNHSDVVMAKKLTRAEYCTWATSVQLKNIPAPYLTAGRTASMHNGVRGNWILVKWKSHVPRKIKQHVENYCNGGHRVD